MLLTDKTIYVHDIWDGKVAGELSNLASGLKIVSAKPGYNRTGLFDYVQIYSPIVVIIATPCWHAPLDVLVGRYLARTDIPLLCVTNHKLWQKRIDPDQLDFFVPRTERVLFRENLTRLLVVDAIHQTLTKRPVL